MFDWLSARTLHGLSGVFRHLIDSTTDQANDEGRQKNGIFFREVAGDVVLVTGAGHGMGR